jgi:hypothetical protein
MNDKPQNERYKADEIQDELAYDSEVVSGMIGTGPHLVVAKDHVHAPMQTVLDTPVQADALIQALSVRWQAAEIHAPFSRSRFSSDRPFGGDHCKRFQAWPALRGVQTVQLVEDVAATHFDPAMILLDDFVELVGVLAGAASKAMKKSSIDSASLG